MRLRLPLTAPALLSALLSGLGCAPSLATMEPARTTPEGHFQMTTSLDVTDTSGPIRDTIEEVREVGGGRMSRGDIRTVADAATAALVQPPSLGYQVSLSYGLSRRFEVGLRSSMNAVRGWTRYQFLRVSPGIYGAVGLGVTGYLHGVPIQRYADEIQDVEMSRWDVDLPLHIGFSSRAFHIWAGPKLIFSTYDATVDVCVDQDEGRCADTAEVGIDGVARYVAGQAGVGIGWKQFFVAAELTLARVDVRADVSVDYAGRTETESFDEDGVVLSPAVGLIIWF